MINYDNNYISLRLFILKENMVGYTITNASRQIKTISTN